MFKPPLLTAAQHERQLRLVRAAPPFDHPLLPADPFDDGKIDPHHLRPVFPGQTRRSNPILVPVQRAQHDRLHDDPALEEQLRPELLYEALRHLCGRDVGILQQVVQEALRALSERHSEPAT